MKRQVGVQMYSVRNKMGKDFEGTVRKIASMGYDGIELAGLPAGTAMPDAVKLFSSLKLKVPSAHMPMPIGDNRAKVIDEAKALGCSILVSGKGPDDFKTPDMIRKTCEQFNESSAAAVKAGLRFAIHNHWWEFEKVGGRVVFDMMLEILDPAVCFEIDTYWVKTGGGDPVAVVKSLGKRAPLLHIKDGPCKQGQKMVAAGTGSMDFPPIIKVADQVEWLIVELDECATDMIEAVRISHDYVRKINR